jgi:hypothetical protein
LNRTCAGPECDRTVFRGDYCAAHVKQQQRRDGRMAPLDTRTPKQRLIDAKEALNDAIDDEDGPTEAEYRSRCDKAERAFFRAATAFGKQSTSTEDRAFLEAAEAHRRRCTAIRDGIAKRRASGLGWGRPKKATTQRIVGIVEQLLRPMSRRAAMRAAARRLKISFDTVKRAWRTRGGGKNNVSAPNRTNQPSSGPHQD